MALWYPMAMGPQQGPQSDQEHQEAEAQPGTWAPHRAHRSSASW